MPICCILNIPQWCRFFFLLLLQLCKWKFLCTICNVYFIQSVLPIILKVTNISEEIVPVTLKIIYLFNLMTLKVHRLFVLQWNP